MSGSAVPPIKPGVIEAPIEQRIRHGAWATFLVPAASLAIQAAENTASFEWVSLLELPIVGALALGLYRKSRAAAVGIVLYLVLVGVVQFIRSRSLPLGPYIILAFFLGRAIPAVFRYHQVESGSAPHAA